MIMLIIIIINILGGMNMLDLIGKMFQSVEDNITSDASIFQTARTDESKLPIIKNLKFTKSCYPLWFNSLMLDIDSNLLHSWKQYGMIEKYYPYRRRIVFDYYGSIYCLIIKKLRDFGISYVYCKKVFEVIIRFRQIIDNILYDIIHISENNVGLDIQSKYVNSKLIIDLSTSADCICKYIDCEESPKFTHPVVIISLFRTIFEFIRRFEYFIDKKSNVCKFNTVKRNSYIGSLLIVCQCADVIHDIKSVDEKYSWDNDIQLLNDSIDIINKYFTIDCTRFGMVNDVASQVNIVRQHRFKLDSAIRNYINNSIHILPIKVVD